MIWVYLTISFYVGVFAGFILHRWLGSRSSYSGTISVTRTPDKTLFSLELEGDPEEIAYKDEVVFQVKTTEENENRD